MKTFLFLLQSTNINSVSFGIKEVSFIAGGIISVLTSYFILQGRVSKLEDSIVSNKEKYDEARAMLQKEVDDLKSDHKTFEKEIVADVKEVKDLLHKMHTEIIQKISEIKK